MPRLRERLFREYCFVVAIVRRRGLSLVALGVMLLVGGVILQAFERPGQYSYFNAVYTTWQLMFGQGPPEVPASWPARVLVFLVPVAGLAVLLEAVVDTASIVRDRRLNHETWCRVMGGLMEGHVVLVGLGKLGLRTFRLLREMGHRVAVIECNTENKFLEEVRREGSPVFVGDARQDHLLSDAGVERAASVVLATSDDMANLEMALDARRLNPAIRVVLRMFDQALADKVREGFAIHQAMSQSAISAPVFAMSALDPDVVGGVAIGDRMHVVVRWPVESHRNLAGRTVGQLIEGHGVSVIEVQTGELRTGYPAPGKTIGAADVVLLQGEMEAITRLRNEVHGT